MDHLYDVAISFLSRDESLAIKISNELVQNLRVFVYSKRQEELAGTDGLDSFRKAFGADSKLVVVLYRDDWGKTKWTAVEEIAIKERMFNGGWDNSLLFVMLDAKSTPPTWLPETYIRLDYGTYGHDALIGAIKMRAQERGSVLKVETAADRAKRAQSSELLRADRDRKLAHEGSEAARREHQTLREKLNKILADSQAELTTIKLEYGNDSNGYIIRADAVGLNFYLHTTVPVTESRIVVQEFDGPLILPANRGRYMHVIGEEPRVIAKSEFYFDYDHAYGWCWRSKGSKGTLITTEILAEHITKRLFDLHEDFKTGKRVRHRERGGDDNVGGSLSWMR
jgi:hypothetical protein